MTERRWPAEGVARVPYWVYSDRTLFEPCVEPARDALVRAQTSFIVVRIMHGDEMIVFATGRYDDRIALDAPQGPRFVEKTVVLDSRLIDTLLAVPL